MFDKSVYPAKRRAPWERKRPKLTHYERMLYNSIISISWQNVWYYRDRMNVPRGPCQLPVLRQVSWRRYFLFALSSTLEQSSAKGECQAVQRSPHSCSPS